MSVDIDEYRKLVNDYVELSDKYIEQNKMFFDIKNYIFHLNYALWAYITQYGNKLSIPKYLLESDRKAIFMVAVSDTAGNVNIEVTVKFEDEDNDNNSDL